MSESKKKVVVSTARPILPPPGADPKKLVLSLTVPERAFLKKVMNDPIFKKALDVINQYRPSLYPADDFGRTAELKLANESNRLREIRGWEFYHARLVTVTEIPSKNKPEVELPEADYGIQDDSDVES